MESRRGTAHLPSPHLRCGAGVRAVQGCRAPTRAPQGFQGSVGAKHTPPTSRRGPGVVGPTQGRVRALGRCASPLHTRDGMCSRRTLSEMCRAHGPGRTQGHPLALRSLTGTALARSASASVHRTCVLPAQCRTPSRPSTCGLGRCVLSGGTRVQVRRAASSRPSTHLHRPCGAPQGFQGSVGAKHTPPTSRRGHGLVGPTQRRVRALGRCASPRHTRDGMCFRRTVCDMCALSEALRFNGRLVGEAASGRSRLRPHGPCGTRGAGFRAQP